MHSSNSHAQENKLPLLVALAVGKALMNTPKSFIEVLFMKGAYVTGIEDESEAIEWWELQVHSRVASDSGSDNEDSSTSDKSSDNRSNEDEDEANAESIDNPSNEDESDVRYVTTTLNPFWVTNEISEYCAALALKKIKEESVSNSEILTDSGVDVTKVDAAKHQCDYEGCNYRTDHRISLKRHKKTHLPADQRLRAHQCDHEGCNYSTDHRGNLKVHKQIHLPADQRPKAQQCDHEGCNHSSPYLDNLKKHKKTHLPADQRVKLYRCDHEGCDYNTDWASDLKKHKQTHLPANQRPKKPKVHQCDHEGCNYSTDQAGNLKRHKQTHLPADQRLKRKASDQPPSNQKRKKGDKE